MVSVIFADADGNQTPLTPAQYSVTLNAPGVGQLWSVGGTVTYPVSGTPIANGTSLIIFRSLPLEQDVTIRNQGNFYAEVTEEALDLQCMGTQQVSARTGQLRGIWVTGADYSYGDIVQDGANGDDTGNYYTCVIANTSNVWQTDLTAGYWALGFNVQQATDAAAEAEAAAADAEASATAAAADAATATGAASAAQTSANDAAASALAASSSASSASTSASTATTQASNANASAMSASASASAASADAITATTQAGIATTQAGIATTQASNAAESAAEAAASASQAVGTLLGTSTTSNLIGTGAKTFTTQSGLALGVGGFVTIANTVTPANYMHGQVTSYSGTTLIINSLDTGGAGTFADWTITTSSPQGPAGVGAGTVTAGTAGELTYYASSGDTVAGNANATISNGQLTLGVATSAQGSIRLSGSTSGQTTLAAAVSGGGTMTLQAGSDTLLGRATTDTLTNKTLSASSNVLGGVTVTMGSDAQGDIYYRNASGILTRLANGGANTVLHGSGTVPAYSAVVEGDISLSDITTNNVSSTRHGFAPKSSADATLFLNGAATPAYAAVKDSDLSTSDITTNNATSAKHGFLPKLSNVATEFLNGQGGWTSPSVALQQQMTVFTSSGTFTTSSNITTDTVFKFTIVGGGGGGGSSSITAGTAAGGGGAGSTAIYVVSGLTPSTGYTVTVGGAGSAGSAGGNAGGTGGSSSVVIGGTTPTAGGGSGGAAGVGASSSKFGGAGGTATDGTINITGGSGGNSSSTAASATAMGGGGGSSSMGGGGRGGVSGAGVAGQAYGSGGGGGGSNGGGSAGRAGIVIVEWLE